MRSEQEGRDWEAAASRRKRPGTLSSSKSEATLRTGKFNTASTLASFRTASPAWLDDSLLSARVGLRRAMHTRKITELEEAIATGSSAQLYTDELEQGRRALDMERKAAARARIKEAERARDVERWYAAVRDGEAAGLSRGVLADTLRELSAEEARIAARAEIRMAMFRNGNVEVLAAAVALGEEVGLSEMELSRPKELLASAREKLSAQQEMQRATRSCNLGELEASLRRGAQLHIQGCAEFRDAERALREERERIVCRLELKDACLRKSATLEGQIEDLRTAVERGESAGLDEPELVRARGTLENDERIDRARAKLRAAEQSLKLKDLLKAIEVGEAAGLDPSELANARRLQVDAYKPAAREQLKAAVASRDIEELKAAIQYGEEVGITNMGLGEARETLVAEERKVKARAGLREVARGREIAKLFTAIRVGEGVGLTEPELEPYRIILAEEQRKAAAREGLLAAAAQRLIVPLRAAVEEGVAAGLEAEAPELRGGRQALAEALETEVLKGLVRAIESRQVLELETAVATTESGSQEIDDLRELLGSAKRGPKMEELLAQAREILAVETRKARARERVREAEKRRDIEDLRAACREGEAVGLTYLEIRGAQTALAEEELRVPALQRLRAAVECRDIETLQRAITQGDKAKLTRAELREARETLAVEERKADARAVLERAARSHRVRDLEAAIADGRAVGLAGEELERFEAALAELRRSLARAAVAEAEQSRSIPDLEKAIRRAQRFGLQEAEIARAREIFAEERLRAATDSDAVTTLRTAIAEGERRVPTSLQLPPARTSLPVAQRREVARQTLWAAEQAAEPSELQAAIKRGRREGLEDWELAGALHALENLRRVLSSTNEDLRRVLLAPAGT